MMRGIPDAAACSRMASSWKRLVGLAAKEDIAKLIDRHIA